jgi:hypothetical protein
MVRNMPEPKFEWYKDKAGKFRFRLVAANGETIAASEAYSSKEACINGIESVRKNAPIARVEGPQIIRARFLMETLKPKTYELKPHEIVKLEEGLIAEKTPQGKIKLYVVG